MGKEFNLSEYRQYRGCYGYPERDIKEFIKRLKEVFILKSKVRDGEAVVELGEIEKEIDKLAGDKFIVK